MPIHKKKRIELSKKMKQLGIYEDDLIEKFVSGSGKGGQKTNKTASCVYLKHIPTQIEVKCQQERSRENNRFLARRKLCEHISLEINREKTIKQQLIKKNRKQKRRRARRTKEKNKCLEKKYHQTSQKTDKEQC